MNEILRLHNAILFLIIFFLLSGCDDNNNRSRPSTNNGTGAEMKPIPFFDPALQNTDANSYATTPTAFIEWIRNEIDSEFDFPAKRISKFHMSEDFSFFICGMGSSGVTNEYWILSAIVIENIKEKVKFDPLDVKIKTNTGVALPVIDKHDNLDRGNNVPGTGPNQSGIPESNFGFVLIKISDQDVSIDNFSLRYDWGEYQDEIILNSEILKELGVFRLRSSSGSGIAQ